MSVLLIFENKDVLPWAESLKSKLSNVKIEIFPNVKNTEEVDFIVCWKPKANILNQFQNVKVIQSVGASVDHIINKQSINKGVSITRIVDEKLSNDMWEFLLSVVMSQIKNSVIYQNQQKAKVWQQIHYKAIGDTSLAILGLGKIGAYVAEKFAKLGFNVNGWSNSKKEISNVNCYNGKDELVSCIKDADYLINLLPLTNETKNILNILTLKELKQDAYFINAGRGEHLVDTDLIEILDSSKLSGAFLDVFRTEPLPKEHQFWSHPKIQITPHIASLTNLESACDQIAENYYRFINRKELLNQVSINKGY